MEKKLKKYLLIFTVAALTASAAFSQSSQKLSEIINTQKATYGQVAYLSAVYSSLIDEEADYSEAVQKLKENNLIKSDTDAASPVKLQDLSYICAKTANLKGGLFYTLTDSPRYALRELKAKGIVPAVKDPSSYVTGREVIAVFNELLSQDNEEETN